MFIQGRGTFLEFYGVLVIPLLERGFNVWMFDLTGQGGSSRILEANKHDFLSVQHLQHVENFDLYIQDMHDFLSDIVSPNSQVPLILGGYSTGGHLALRYVQSFPDSIFESIFAISPLLYLKTPVPNSFLSYFLWTASWMMDFEKYFPGTGHEDPIYNMSFSENPYTSDENSFQEIVHLCQKHPSLMMGGASISWVNAASNSLIQLWKKDALDNIQIPLLIATGGADGVVDVTYNENFSQQLKKSKHVYYPEGRHELFRENEKIKANWWKDFDMFFIKNSDKYSE